MFKIDVLVSIEGFKPFTASAIEWQTSVKDYINTASVTLPSKVWYKGNFVRADEVIQEGKKINIYAGYNGNLQERFRGFIARVNSSIPVVLTCEGYAYALREVRGYSNYAQNVTVKEILQEILAGTGIKLSSTNPEVRLSNVSLTNLSAWEVLDFIEEQGLRVFFKADVLYIDLEEKVTGRSVNLYLGRNTKKDKGLKFTDPDLANVGIKLNAPTGVTNGLFTEVTTTVGNATSVVERQTLVDNPQNQRIIAESLQRQEATKGYEGSVTCFLSPLIEAGDKAEIKDNINPKRNGSYFVSEVKGKVSKSSCYQNVKLSYGI